MTQANQLQLYPNSAIDGQPIPFDVIQTAATAKQSFSSAAINNVAIPSYAEIMVIYADDIAPCYIALAVNVVVPPNNVPVLNLHYLPTSAIKAIDLNGATAYSIISADGVAGVVHIEYAKKWKDTRNQQQYSRM
jgi:hypothetical protein